VRSVRPNRPVLFASDAPTRMITAIAANVYRSLTPAGQRPEAAGGHGDDRPRV